MELSNPKSVALAMVMSATQRPPAVLLQGASMKPSSCDSSGEPGVNRTSMPETGFAPCHTVMAHAEMRQKESVDTRMPTM